MTSVLTLVFWCGLNKQDTLASLRGAGRQIPYVCAEPGILVPLFLLLVLS